MQSMKSRGLRTADRDASLLDRDMSENPGASVLLGAGVVTNRRNGRQGQAARAAKAGQPFDLMRPRRPGRFLMDHGSVGSPVDGSSPGPLTPFGGERYKAALASAAEASMTQYASSIWSLRYFWGSLVSSDLRARYRGSWLGMGWSLLHPLAMSAVLCTVFHSLFAIEIREFGPMLLAGLGIWGFIAGCATGGCDAFISSESYIRQRPVPMAIYPLRATLVAGFHLLMTVTAAVLVNAMFNGPDRLLGLAAIVVTAPMLLMLGWATSVLAAFAHTYLRDAKHLLEVGLQVLFYATPVIYPVELLRGRGAGWLVDLNPLAAVMITVRDCLLASSAPDPLTLAVACGFTAAVSAMALVAVAKLERRVIFQL